jgi:hypothetical protein
MKEKSHWVLLKELRGRLKGVFMVFASRRKLPEVDDVAAAKMGDIRCGNRTAGQEVCPAVSRRTVSLMRLHNKTPFGSPHHLSPQWRQIF